MQLLALTSARFGTDRSRLEMKASGEHSKQSVTVATRPGEDPWEALRASVGERVRLSLLVYHREGAELAHLSRRHALVIGRGSDCDLRVGDAGLSRRHARFSVRGDVVVVEDLGSKNGVRINGELVKEAEVGPHDRLTLGTLPVVVNRLDPLEERLGGLERHESFIAHLDEELARCRLFGRHATLLLVGQRPKTSRRAEVCRYAPALRELLRPFDRLGHYSPTQLEVLYGESTEEQSQALAEQILATGERLGTPLLCGAAMFPHHGASASELQLAAQDAFHRASPATAALRWADEVARPPADDLDESKRLSADKGPILRGPYIRRVYQIIERVAPKKVPVLIRGETGTGKELAAQALHRRSQRSRGPLHAINCAALPTHLLQSAIFGHEKGAFTGAHQRQKGLFEAAHGGTLFLDEVGELPLNAQSSLLRVLETQRFCRLGSTKEIGVDVRFVAATHRDLEEMVRTGGFRQDLFFRLNVLTVDLPPLRARCDELEALAYYFVAQANEQNGCAIEGIDTDALEAMLSYPWPGNIRELRNAMERAVVIAQGKTITLDDLPTSLQHVDPAVTFVAAPDAAVSRSLRGRVREYEAAIIRQTLVELGKDRQAAADLLGISLRTLAQKMSVAGIRLRDL
ncbi:MAG: sigma-54-dependent Fis family transcriptional regulator [Deltaproteobacteria bacterium]|nr:MAG: sigma-54-dependent Fis family transcriptional regulator [Pseudomonadota bacterium]PIE66063.1 MAG: sigma-54-dependent Fis family transcriptional regulator [Deltaproteobacteria bacterium]